MGITSRLKVMSFLQYFIWGSWLVTLGSYMINTLDFTGANVGMVYSSKGLAAIIMPGIMGIIADKWLRAERAYMLCHLVCAGALLYATTVTDPQTMFWVMLVNAMAYMPTIALSNSVSYSCLAKAGQDPVTSFPPVLWGGNHFCTDRRRYEFIVKSTMARPAGNLGILHCAEKNDLKMIFLLWILHSNDFRLNRFKSTFNHCPNS